MARSISYLITVSRAHLVPAQMLIMTLRKKTKAPIVVVGNLEPEQAKTITELGAQYIDEGSIDYKGRLPKVNWQEKYRAFGWYKQMFIRLCIDTFMTTEQVVILDSEVFVFDNWDEAKFYDSSTGNPRCFCWTPKIRKPEWDYKMYQGAAYLLSFLPECKGIMKYAHSNQFKRHISGVVLFSTKNVAKLWEVLAQKTELQKNLHTLFNQEPELAFSDHDLYGLAVEYGLFADTVPTQMYEGLLGWYEGHDDPVFEEFKHGAMWSMCQNYANYPTTIDYYRYMKKTADSLNAKLPIRSNRLAKPSHHTAQSRSLKRITKDIAKRVAPSMAVELARLKQIEARIEEANSLNQQLNDKLATHDFRIDTLRQLAAQVEPYQPAYGLTNVIEQPRRTSQERARVMEAWLNPVAGQRILDIGSSLGYFSYYFADRGAAIEAWESNANNAEVCRLIGELNGIGIDLKTKELNQETVQTIAPDTFDTVFILSVFHHIVYFNGLEYTQRLIKELFDRIPVMIVELAKKGEDSKLRWDKSQPDNELALFDLVKDDITITKIGEFHNHLSAKTRPLYAIERKKIIKVGSHAYSYARMSKQAYKDSPVAYAGTTRRYYFGPSTVTKHYSFEGSIREDNLIQGLNELRYLLAIRSGTLKVRKAPKLLDFNVNYPKDIKITLSLVDGVLGSDLAVPLKSPQALKVTKDVLRGLADLHKNGLHHNDVRSWNIIIDKKYGGWLIDYGIVGPMAQEDDIIALLWALHAMLTNERELPNKNKTALPPRAPFETAPKLTALYESIKSGTRSPEVLLKQL